MTTPNLGLLYRRSGNPELQEAAVAGQSRPLLEVFSDAGFAPQGARSQECSIAFWRDSAIFWYSSRQPFVAQSTCEAELLTIVSASNLGESFMALTQELGSGQVPRCVSRNDNSAAVLLASAESSAWRTRHLRIRASVLREKVATNQWEVHHVPGARNPADVGTKVLPASRMETLRSLIGMGGLPSAVKATQAEVKRVAGILYALVLGTCVSPSQATKVRAGDKDSSGDTLLWVAVVVWTLAVIALWEIVRWCVDKGGRRVREPDPEEDPRVALRNEPSDAGSPVSEPQAESDLSDAGSDPLPPPPPRPMHDPDEVPRPPPSGHMLVPDEPVGLLNPIFPFTFLSPILKLRVRETPSM